MRFTTILAMIFALCTPAAATPQSKDAVGIITAVVGAGLILGAFNYSSECDGYRTQIDSNYSIGYSGADYCTTFTSRGSRTRETPLNISLARPTLLYTGIGAMIGGTILATAFNRTPGLKDVTLQVGPGGVRVEKAFSF